MPKKALVAFGLIAAVAVPLAVGAYGPERPVTAYPQAADHITFNSMTGNPAIGGDERNFVAARVDDGSTSVNKVWNEDSIAVEEGKSYMVRLYVHNNAAANLNLVATNTRAYAAIPTNYAKTAAVEGYVSADNASPRQVYDYVNFTSSRNFKLSIDSDYGVHWANNSIGRTTDAKLDYYNFFNSNGALLGYSQLDGKIPGCFEYAGFVSFKVRPIFEQTATDFSMSKRVSKHDAKTWGDTYTAQPDELVDFRIDYTNVTGETQNNVTFRDALPAGMTVQSQEFWNNKTGAYQVPTTDVTGIGVNTGSVAGKGTTGRVNLTVKMPSADKLACGVNTFNNVGFVSINGGLAKEDGATVVVTKNCPKPDPVYTCNALNINKISRIKFDLSNTYTAQNGAIYKNTTYEVTAPDGTKTTQTLTGTYTYENSKVGKYTVVATANFDVDGVAKSVTSNGCKGEFTVDAEPQPDPVYTCNVVEIKKISRIKFDLSNTYTAQNGAVYKDTTYEVTDPDGHKTTHTKSGVYSYENTKVGKYTVVATANFTVNGEAKSVTSGGCQGEFEVEPPQPEPVYVCNVVNIDKTSRTTFQFTTDYTIADTTYLNVTYVITGPDVNDTKISTAADGGLYYNQTKPGTYTVTATLNTTDGHATSAGCAKTFVVEPEPVPTEAICKILTADKTVVKIGQVDPAVNFRVYPEYRGNVTFNGSWMDFGDGTTTSLMNIVNYTHTYLTAGAYTAKAYVNFQVDDMVYDVTSVDCELPILVVAEDEKCPIPGKGDLDKDDPRCKPDPEMCKVPGLENLPANDPRCKWPIDHCKVPGKEYLPANDPRCVPDTIDHCKVPGKEYLPANDPKCVSGPSQLPTTGAEAAGIVGLGSLVTSAGYYLTSRRRLGKL